MSSEQIPHDDDIKKTDLWLRIDGLRSVVESHVAGLSYQIDTVKLHAAKEIGSLAEANKQFIDNASRMLADTIKQARASMDDSVKNEIKRFEGKLDEFKRTLDSRLAMLDSRVDLRVQAEIKENLAYFAARANELTSTVEEFKKSLTNAITKTQLETNSKIGQMDKLFKSVKEKFAALAEIVK